MAKATLDGLFFSCNKIILNIFSANFNKPESCQSGSTASNVFNDSSVVSPISVNSHMYDSKVIVKDIFSNDETGKFKALNVSQDKTHSAHSRKSADLDVPDYLEKKAAILWPQMCDEEAWTKLETAVMPKVLQSSLPIAQTMSLLQDEIHTKASTLFGLVTQRKKCTVRSTEEHYYLSNLSKKKTIFLVKY